MKNKLRKSLAYYYAAFFARPRLAGIHYAMFRASIRGLGVLNYYDRMVSGEEFAITKLLPKLIQNSKPVLFDVGANRGEYTISLARQFPEAFIFAFEPHPLNFEELARLNFPNFSAYRLALGDKPGETILFDRADEDGSTNASLHENVITDIHGSKSIPHSVKLETLDDFSLRLSIDFIDFIKIDAEGSELAILVGGQKLLKEKRIGIIQYEFNEMNVVSRSFLYDFKRLLRGYKLFRLLPNGLLPIPDSPLTSELFGFQNIIAISGNIPQNL